MDKAWRDVINAVSVGALAAFVWIPDLVSMLLGLIVMDIATGMAYAYCNGKVCSSIQRKGLVKKSQVLLLVTAGYWVQHWAGGGIPVGPAIAAFYCGNELLSIIENAGRLGIPIAPALRKGLAALNKEDDEKE